jgi:hypothetical protein
MHHRFWCLAAVVLPAWLSRSERSDLRPDRNADARLITKISPTQVTIQATGISRDFDTKDILRISFGDEPAELRTVRERRRPGSTRTRWKNVEKIDVAAIENPNIRAEVGYYMRLQPRPTGVDRRRGQSGGDQQMMNFIRENPETYRYFEGVELLGDLHFASGEFDQAARFYGLIGSRAPWPEYQMRAAVLQGRALAEAGKHDEALTNFDRVLSSGLSTAAAVEQKMHATVGRAVCLAATGRSEEGIKIIHDLIAKNDPNDPDLFGRAYNALGACYVKAGATKKPCWRTCTPTCCTSPIHKLTPSRCTTWPSSGTRSTGRIGRSTGSQLAAEPLSEQPVGLDAVDRSCAVDKEDLAAGWCFTRRPAAV